MSISDRMKRHVLSLKLEGKRPNKKEPYRASGSAVCNECLEEFRLHPKIEGCLILLCNGDRVKL